MKLTELEPIETTTRVRWSGEKPRPCTMSWPRYKGERFAGCGSPSRMTPSSLFAWGSITETVLENCSAAYTRSRPLTGMSGAVAAPGACPAKDGTAISAAADRAANERDISVLLWHVGRDLRRRRAAGRQRIAQRQVHHRDLLLLVDDDLLREPPQALVLPVAQLGQSHVDGALVVRDHHPREVPVRVAGEPHVHRRVHARVGIDHHGLEPVSRRRAGRVRSRAEERETQDHDPRSRTSRSASSRHVTPPCSTARRRGSGHELPDDLRQTDPALHHRRRALESDPTLVE